MEEFLPEIRRARFEKLTIYEVEHSELELLERGSPDSIFLNVAIALLSVALSTTAILFTTQVLGRTFVVFVVFAVVGYVVGVVLLLLWWRSRQSIHRCIQTIRRRLPPEGVPETIEQK